MTSKAEIMEKAITLRKKGQVEEALELLHSLCPAPLNTNHKSESVAQVIHEMGKCQRLAGNAEKSLELNMRALAIREKLGDSVLIGDTMNSLGLNYWGMGQLDKAFLYLNKALDLQRQGDDILGQAVTLNSIGLVLWRMSKNSEAAESFVRAQSLFLQVDSKEGMANCLNNLALLAEEDNRPTQALSCYQQALELFREINNQPGEANTLNNMALLYHNNDDFCNAETALDKSIALSESLGLGRTLMLATFGKAQLYDKMGRYMESKTFFEKAEALAQQQNEGDTLQDLYRLWAESYAKQGLFKKAYKKMEYYNAAREDFLNQENNKVLANLQMEYKVAQKDWEHKLITEKNKLLEKANKTKLQLFSIISHDLRSSAGGVRQIADLIARKSHGLNSQQKDELLEDICVASQGTVDLLNQLLNWSRGQMESFDSMPGWYNVALFVEKVLETVVMQMDQKELSLKVDVDDNLEGWFDKETMAVVLRNVLTNAIKFSHRGRSVFIYGTSRNKDIVISVEDQGDGISADQLVRLNNDDISLSSPGTENEKGSGLGLSLCRLFTEKNQGTFTIKSELGQGTRIEIVLPGEEC